MLFVINLVSAKKSFKFLDNKARESSESGYTFLELTPRSTGPAEGMLESFVLVLAFFTFYPSVTTHGRALDQ